MDKNPRDEIGWTPLHAAATKGHLDICQLIAERIEDNNPVDTKGVTPQQILLDRLNAMNWSQIFMIKTKD